MVVAAALALVAALAGTAVANQTVKVDSKLAVAKNGAPYSGHVKSSEHACEAQRTVKLFKMRSGPNQLIGEDTSNSSGAWKVLLDPIKPGRYQLKVLRREEGTAGTTFVCRGDRSKVFDTH